MTIAMRIPSFLVMATWVATAALVAATAPAVATSWSRTYGSGGGETPFEVQATSDGGLVMIGDIESPGGTNTAHWIVKVDAAGEIEWQAAYGGAYLDTHASIQQLPDGGYIVAARSRSVTCLGMECLWVFRLDASGNITWQRMATSDLFSFYPDPRVVALRDGGWIVGTNTTTGLHWWLTRFEADGDIAWQELLGSPRRGAHFNAITEAVDGTLLACGALQEPSWLYRSGWVVRLDSSGGVLWQKAFDRGTDSHLWSIADLGAEGLVVLGPAWGGTSHPERIWVLRLDYDGNVLWERTYGDPIRRYPAGAIVALPSGFAVASDVSSGSPSGVDALTLRLDGSGNILGQRALGGTGRDRIYWAAPMADGGYAFMGFTESFGAGFQNLWLLRHDAADNPGASCDFVSASDVAMFESTPVVEDTAATVTPETVAFVPVNGNRWPTDGVTTLLCERDPPDCDQAVASPAELWPPNHGMVPVEVSSPTLTIVITGVRSDEPVEDRGDGSFAPDAVIQGGSVTLLRAERDGRANGRVYTIDFTATDPSGASCDGSVTVGVPRSRGRRAGPIDDGPRFDATEGAAARRGGRGHGLPRR